VLAYRTTVAVHFKGSKGQQVVAGVAGMGLTLSAPQRNNE
jgi:hypothetical protein